MLKKIDCFIEPFLALCIVAALCHIYWFVQMYGYIPRPFFFDPSDSLMDWYNTAIWAYDRGTYDSWNSIYPPISFLFLRIFSVTKCFVGTEGYPARDCDWAGPATLGAFFLLNIVLVGKSYFKIDRRTAVSRTLALSCGLPMLYALERGNVIIVCFTCFVLGYGPLVKYARLRWLAIGIAVNFKIYLIGSVFAQLLRRRWRWFEGCIISIVGVYAITWGIYGIGTPGEIYTNIQQFSGGYQAVNFLDLWYAGTYTPVVSLLNGSTFPIASAVGSHNMEVWSFIFQMLLHVVQVLIVVASLMAYMRPETVPMYRLTNFGTSFALITAESGGYTQILIIYLTLMEPWKGVGRRWATIACYILCIPADLMMHRVDPLIRDSFITGRPVIVDNIISYGPFLRPGLILSIGGALACVTIRQVWLDIRQQGWKGRHRYRFDFPFFAHGGRKIDPSEVSAAS